MRRNVYLQMKPLAGAAKEFLGAFDWVALAGSRVVASAEARGRATAQPVFANFSSPSYHSAAMDGIAVRASETYGADENQPLLLKKDHQALYINTGQPLPQGFDAVIMIEQVHQASAQHLEIRRPAFPWQHVRKVGEDFVATEMLLPHHHIITPADQAALLQAGVFHLEVLKRPRAAIIPTGNELLSWEEAHDRPPQPGQIIETNSLFLAGLIEEAGGLAQVLPRRTDDYEGIKEALQAALGSDAAMVVINAGASAGSQDYTVHVLKELGTVLVHGVQAMPGKPTILGKVQDKPVVGSPGYPVSAWVCMDQFIAPALALMQGQAPRTRGRVQAVPARPMASKLGQEEFLRVHLGRVGEKIVATPLKRGAGAITSLTRADGILRIPAGSDGLNQGEPFPAELLRPLQAVERTLVIVGSHDVTLDILADQMRNLDPRIHVSSSHVGSVAGLMAIRAGRCHLGGTHLLDPETGEYNLSYLRRYLPGMPLRLVTLARRRQGLMVARDNPKGIQRLADLAKEGVVMVNRQAGSGTRVLLDYHLRNEGLDPAAIIGYDSEEYTHMGVAVQVLSGGADVGLGILAAAQALGLDFLPLMEERFDLCIPAAHWEDHRVQVLLETLRSDRFRTTVDKLGGYDTGPMGQVVKISEA